MITNMHQNAKIYCLLALPAFPCHIFPHNRIIMEIPAARQLPCWTHSSQTWGQTGFQTTLWLLDSTINTHKPFCRRPRNPKQIFRLFCNHNLHTASEKHICQKDRSVRTAVIFWLSNLMRQLLMWEQTAGITIFCRILVDPGICCGLILAILEIGTTKHGIDIWYLYGLFTMQFGLWQ